MDEIERARRLLVDAGFVVMEKNNWRRELEDQYDRGVADGEHAANERWEESEPDEVLVSYCECDHSQGEHSLAGTCTRCPCGAFTPKLVTDITEIL